MSRIRDLGEYVVSAVTGGAIGYGFSALGKFTADVNFRVRPELAHLNWSEAFVSGHLDDWLFKMYPEPTTMAYVAGTAAIVTGVVWYLKTQL